LLLFCHFVIFCQRNGSREGGGLPIAWRLPRVLGVVSGGVWMELRDSRCMDGLHDADESSIFVL